MNQLRILPVSESALLAELVSEEDTLALHGALMRATPPGVEELVPAARTILIRFRPGRDAADRIAMDIRSLAGTSPPRAEHPAIELPARYDGEDLPALAATLGVTPGELIRRHCEANWRVAFLGFAPGFAYLRCDDPLFDVPRLPAPRTRVPAGSIALAGRYSGVYPRSSPGGWQLIGHTDAVLWDVERDPPALLHPGARVRFRAVRGSIGLPASPSPVHSSPPRPSPARLSPARLNLAPPSPASGLAGRPPRAELMIARAGLQLLVQDLGRPGFAALGVSRSGAADRRALRAANRLAGNAPGAAVLEIIGGAELMSRGRLLLAYAGAPAELTIEAADGEEGEARSVPRGRPFSLREGEVLRIGPATRGLRGYLAVRGGIETPRVLASRARDTLSGLGPPPLTPGDRLPVGAQSGPALAVSLDETLPDPPGPGEMVTVGLLPGPRSDWLTPGSRAALRERQWAVTGASDRIGLRLRGEQPLSRARRDELEPEGIVPGAVQLPPDGQPVIFLADHPVTGGYPVIGVVAAAHLDLLGQLPPGAIIRFSRAGG